MKKVAKKLRVVFKKVGERPAVIEVENELESLQELVDGSLEKINLFEPYSVMVNEVARLIPLPLNVGRIFGNFFVTKTRGSKWVSLSDIETSTAIKLIESGIPLTSSPIDGEPFKVTAFKTIEELHQFIAEQRKIQKQFEETLRQAWQQY